MAKTIKFNLICDGKPIRTIEDFQNNFSIEDVLDYYKSKLLHKWLSVRGYEKELKTINKISSEDDVEILKSLIDVFEINLDSNEIDESLFILEHTAARIMFIEDYKKNNFKIKSVVSDYIAMYNNKVEHIIENNQDIAQIKAAVKIILDEYYDLFKIDYRCLFYKLLKDAPMAIFVLLTFKKARDLYLPKKTEEEKLVLDNLVDIKNEYEMNLKDCDDIYHEICLLNRAPDKILMDNLLSFSGQTDGYWKDIETNDKKYMVFRIGSGDYVRSSNEKGGDLGYNDVVDKFVILDGIDYKSNNGKNRITYMEV
ncbi:MAG: hypothetical protein IJE93_02250 [Clostridia bacterium]|nr:hypothetical protein [Clostridia bacterium]